MSKTASRALSLLIIAGLLMTFLASPTTVHAASITVTTSDDENGGNLSKCSLREAIIAANTDKPYGGCPAGSGVDNIFVPYFPGKDYILKKSNGGSLEITTSMNISGSGNLTHIYAESGFNDRIFYVRTPTAAPKINVAISNMRISSGYSTSGAGGGGILNLNANLSLSKVRIENNIVSSSQVGGGIYNTKGSTLTVNISTFSGNVAGHGGAIYNEGILILNNSLLDDNRAAGGGGGLDNNPDDQVNGYASVTNTTITRNTATSGAGILSIGNLALINTTIADNSGAGLRINRGDKITVRSTIFARHSTTGNCVVDPQFSGSFVSQGYNLVDSTSVSGTGLTACNFNGTGDIKNQPASLSVNIALHGSSPTMTYSFVNNESLAIDAIPLSAGINFCPASDQRLYPRWVDGNEDGTVGCDIGAYEFGGVLSYIYLPMISR
jgi:CSLREA domain-containing protein